MWIAIRYWQGFPCILCMTCSLVILLTIQSKIIIRNGSSKFTIHLCPKYTVFLFLPSLFSDIPDWKIFHTLFSTFKFISWTTAVASLMAVLLPVCPTGSGMEEKPNSASVSSSEQCSCGSFAQYHHHDYKINCNGKL